jgi:hypothetical protein
LDTGLCKGCAQPDWLYLESEVAMDVEREERRCEIRFGGDVVRGLSISDALDAEEEFGTTTTGCCHRSWAMLLLWVVLLP